jgi:hypothetical protein
MTKTKRMTKRQKAAAEQLAKDLAFLASVEVELEATRTGIRATVGLMPGIEFTHRFGGALSAVRTNDPREIRCAIYEATDVSLRDAATVALASLPSYL